MNRYLIPAAFPAAVAACLATAILASPPALAQTASPSVSIEAATDLRERGLSWSDGKPAMSLDATLPLSHSVTVDFGAATLRDSPRHGGADLGLEVAPEIMLLSSGGWTLSAGATGHVFVGGAGLSYAEAKSTLSYAIGPAQLALGASYAPSQKAIGGSNLYLEGNIAMSIPTTALTLYGGGGYSTGSTRGDALAAERVRRLRPDGSYWDYYLGVEHQMDRLALGLRYTGTSVGDDLAPGRYVDRDTGSRLAAYLRFTP
ncbi:TorF family putative porin [Novosphingobium sp.]|uniref:TorF family putative porin n=1 Tax=Novosphingobium sp. TaxID=1874826 RepID=UPI0028A5EB51|nr:TorF family putative porin [Novosphingobium sp.]